MPPEKGPLTLKSDGNRPVRPDGWEQIDKPELSENETSGKPMSVVLTDAIALGRPWFNCTSLNRPGVALADVRFGAHSGLKSDIAPSPKSAKFGSRRSPRIFIQCAVSLVPRGLRKMKLLQ